jgi:hypothetical protein
LSRNETDVAETGQIVARLPYCLLGDDDDDEEEEEEED